MLRSFSSFVCRLFFRFLRLGADCVLGSVLVMMYFTSIALVLATILIAIGFKEAVAGFAWEIRVLPFVYQIGVTFSVIVVSFMGVWHIVFAYRDFVSALDQCERRWEKRIATFLQDAEEYLRPVLEEWEVWVRAALRTRFWRREMSRDLIILVLAPPLGLFVYYSFTGVERWGGAFMVLAPFLLMFANCVKLRDQAENMLHDEHEQRAAAQRHWRFLVGHPGLRSSFIFSRPPRCDE